MTAQQNPQFISVPAGSDLSAKRYYFMDIVSGQLSVAGAGTRVAGVLDNNPDTAGKAGTLQFGGVAKVLTGGSITAGAGVAADASGKAVAASGSAFVCGIALESRGSGEYAPVLLTGASAVGLAANSETVTSGALSPGIPTSLLSITNTVALTLADGSYVGQRKRIEVSEVSGTPAGTLTINDAFGSEPTSWIFTAVGQMIDLEWTATGWRLLDLRAAGADAPAAGATPLNLLVALHAVTVADTVDWILPSGVIPGQMQSIKVAANSGTPVGTISGLFYTTAGAATGTDINFNAASDSAVVVWNGSRWDPISLVSATVS